MNAFEWCLGSYSKSQDLTPGVRDVAVVAALHAVRKHPERVLDALAVGRPVFAPLVCVVAHSARVDFAPRRRPEPEAGVTRLCI